MPNSSYVQTDFTGGEISATAQGRLDLPAYKKSLSTCLNFIPIESGALMRRPGTRHVAPTRGGAHAKLISFAFAQSSPYVMEFTDGFLRFTTGPALVMTNDAQTVVSISSANPAVVQTAGAHGWSTGDSGMFNSLGVNNPLLQNRQLKFTVIDPTHFSIADAITGAAIDGSTLGVFVSGNVTRILEIRTTYAAGSWASVKSVQAESRTVLLNGSHPQVLQVQAQPTKTSFATFTFGAANFIDGPYLDPTANSVMTPSGGLNGVITLTLSFGAYDATKAYNIGDFVSFGGQGYKSIAALNQNNPPSTSPTKWTPVNGGAAVNGGLGFVASDIGRLIRLFSEPQLWSPTNSYAAGTVVAYADGNGGFSYWTAMGAISAGVQPGTNVTWALNATGAQWTWAQIVSVSGSGLIVPQTAIGNLSNISAAFDGNPSKNFASSANFSQGITTYPPWSSTNYSNGAIVQLNGTLWQTQLAIVASSSAPVWNSSTAYSAGSVVQYSSIVYQANNPSGGNNPLLPIQPGSDLDKRANTWRVVSVISPYPPASPNWAIIGTVSSPTYDFYIGQHFSSGVTIASATLYPANDIGINNSPNATTSVVHLRASNSAPTSPSSGTLLGTTGASGTFTTPVTINSSDTTSTWTYVWFEVIAYFTQPLPDNGSHVFTAEVGVAQVQFLSNNISNGSVVTAQIRGPALLYNQPIRTWRAGVYSDTTGWPTCGTYHEGRLWLGGVVSNRFDAGVSNGISGTQLDFTPTSTGGTVSDSNAISYTCNGEQVNQILWMKPDQQGILFGTQEGPWLISAPSPGALTPTNIKAVRVSGPGSANIEPRRAEHTLLYVHRFARKLIENFADVFSGKFTAPNLTERAKHLTVSGIAEIAYQQELAPIVWCRRNDGALVGATYKRDTLTTSQGPTIIGWHRHTLGSARLVESICVGPSQDGTLDALSMVTNDTGTGIRHIEMLTDLLDEDFALTDCWFLDDAMVPSSTVIQSAPTGGVYGSLLVNGLSAHNGKTVTAYIAGLDCGDYVVSNGSITVPFGDGVSGGTANGLFTQALVQSFPTLPAVIGFTYKSDAKQVRPVTPADTGAAAGPGFAKLGRNHRAGALMYGMVNGSISFGSDFTTLYAANLRYPNDIAYSVNQQWSGIWRDNVNANLDFDGWIAWRISRPNPGFIMSVGGFDSKADV